MANNADELSGSYGNEGGICKVLMEIYPKSIAWGQVHRVCVNLNAQWVGRLEDCID